MINKLFVAAALLMLAPLSQCRAGITTVTGAEATLWTEERTSLIIARVLSVESRGKSKFAAALIPIATLAGSLDPTSMAQLDVRFIAGSWGTSIRAAPARDALVMAVVRLDLMQGDEKTPSNWVVSAVCAFMPEKSSLVELRTLDDPRVAETVERVRKARAADKHD